MCCLKLLRKSKGRWIAVSASLMLAIGLASGTVFADEIQSSSVNVGIEEQVGSVLPETQVLPENKEKGQADEELKPKQASGELIAEGDTSLEEIEKKEELASESEPVLKEEKDVTLEKLPIVEEVQGAKPQEKLHETKKEDPVDRVTNEKATREEQKASHSKVTNPWTANSVDEIHSEIVRQEELELS